MMAAWMGLVQSERVVCLFDEEGGRIFSQILYNIARALLDLED